MNTDKIKQDFPILQRKINGKRLIYLDSAATSLTPSIVIDKIKHFYENYNSNIHRGVYTISEEATLAYEETRNKVAEFINANESEIIFTKNSTEAMNIAAHSIINELKEGDEILVSEIEHHSNLVTWQQLAKKKNIKVKYVKYQDGKVDILPEINEKTKVVAITHKSNVLGIINDIKEICKKAHKYSAYVIVDGAQSITNSQIDVRDLDCDFFAFSAHKMLGPFGVGILYGKKELLEKTSPLLYGGDMIKEVTLEGTKFNDLPWKFEAGTPNVADVIAFSAAIDYLKNVGMDNIKAHQRELTEYSTKKLNEIPNIKIYSNGIGVLSFNIFDSDNNLIHPHDVSSFLDQDGICVRGGHMCAQPLMKKLQQPGVVRASFYIYNTKEDIDTLMDSIQKVQTLFETPKKIKVIS